MGKDTATQVREAQRVPYRISESESEVVSDSLQPHEPGSSIHGIFQARVLEWVAISFSTIQVKPKKKHAKTHINQTNKN